MTKYIELNGTRHDLDEEGHLFVEHDGGTFHFDPEEVRALGLVIKEEEKSPFERLPDGVYQSVGKFESRENSPAKTGYRVFKLEAGIWEENGEGVEASDRTYLQMWHREGNLFQLYTREATNA